MNVIISYGHLDFENSSPLISLFNGATNYEY